MMTIEKLIERKESIAKALKDANNALSKWRWEMKLAVDLLVREKMPSTDVLDMGRLLAVVRAGDIFYITHSYNPPEVTCFLATKQVSFERKKITGAIPVWCSQDQDEISDWIDHASGGGILYKDKP